MATTPAKLSDLPVDILLHLLRFCDLADNVSFSMVCAFFYNLSQQRGYWINALQKARLIRPIACPLREDLTKHDCQRLKRIALHTLRLQYNWSLDQPKIKGPIKAVILGVPLLDVVFQVPGTELYVLHSRDNGNISAWDIGLGRRVSPEIYISKQVLDVSPGQDEPGKLSMGLLMSLTPSINGLSVICLEYGPEGVKLSVTLQHTFEPDMYHWAIFMTKEFVGVLRYDVTEMDGEECPIDIIALNLSSGRMASIRTDISRDMVEDGHAGTSIVDGTLFILVEWNNESHVFRCPRDYLPHDGNSTCPPISHLKCNNKDLCSSLKWENDPGVNFIQTEGTLTSDDFYGVPVVSLHLLIKSRDLVPEGEDVDPTSSHRFQIQIRFWTRLKPDHINDLPPCLIPYRNIKIPGRLQDSPDSSWQLMVLPHSGRKVLIVMYFKSEIRLHLVHFDPDTGNIFVQQIDLPPFIDIDQVYGLSLDDHRGVITLLDKRGVLYALPYA